MRFAHVVALQVVSASSLLALSACPHTPPLASAGSGNTSSLPPTVASNQPTPTGTRFPTPALDALRGRAINDVGGNNGGEGEGEGNIVGSGGEGEGEGNVVGGGGEGEGSVVAGEGEGEGTIGGGGHSQLQRVLLIGNSQLGPDEFHANLAGALEELSVAVDGNAHFTVDKVQENGKDCPGYVAVGTGPGSPLERAGSGDYDVVILVPDLSEPKDGSIPCFDTFRTTATNAGSVFGVMATASFSGEYPQGFTSMHDGLLSYASAHPGTLFVPAGKSWQIVLGTDSPTLQELYALYSDLAHPGVRGYSLYVYTLWDVLHGAGTTSTGFTRDFPALRCDQSPGAAACLTQAQLEQCAANNSCASTANGVELDGNGDVSVVTAQQAALYQQAADAAVAQSQP